MNNISYQGNDHKVAGTQEQKINKASEKRNQFIQKAKAYAKEKGVTFKETGFFVTIGDGKRAVSYSRRGFSSYKELKSIIDRA